ncbi:MAG: hypothetical protein M1818_002424 [Claussenomyces sp. TS43310]|nr:MAG: hypothetical protein M1818_002424 [Claussenomyces sp. TS43310]
MEQRSLQFYRLRTALVLSGSFDSDFWNDLLPQVGRSEPTIQHAMMAVASVHEQVEAQGASFSQSYQRDYMRGRDSRFALQQYNKAIRHLNRRVSQDAQSEEIVLSCCLLFICLEFLRGDIERGITHLRNGLHILVNWRDRVGKSSADKASPFPSSSDNISDVLTQILSRQTLQYFLCGRSTCYQHPDISESGQPGPLPATFLTLLEARSSMDHIIKVSLRFLKVAIQSKYEPENEAKINLKKTRQEFAEQLDKWSDAFASLLANKSLVRRQDQRASWTLQILYTVSKIWLGNCLESDEMAYDAHTDGFRTILALVSSLKNDALSENDERSSIWESSSAAKQTHGFTFEMGVITPLYLTVSKSRNPIIRRAAISLLATTIPRREGLWDANLLGAVGQRIMEIEEGSLEVGESRPPEQKRIHDFVINSYDDNRESQCITFMLRPDGPQGDWLLVDEEVTW